MGPLSSPTKPARSFIVAAFIFASILQAQDKKIESHGSGNVNVNDNRGLVIQLNVATPTVSNELKRGAKTRPWKNLLLPANDPIPANECNIPPEALTVILGHGLFAYCSKPECHIIMAPDNMGGPPTDILSVKRDPTQRSMSVHVELFDEKGDIEAAVENGKLLRNRQNTIKWIRPNAHELDVVNNQYRKSLHLRFSNPTTLLVEGIFYTRSHDFLMLGGAASPIGSGCLGESSGTAILITHR